MTGAEIAIGKAFFDVFKWAWKEFPAKSVWHKFQFKSAAKAYAEKMEKRYGKMQLWKMNAPTTVDKIFTQVNILQKQSAFRSIPKAQLEDIYLNKAGFGEVIEKGKDGMAVVKELDRLFILGKPGAGKTTFLKHIALEAIGGQFEAIPIFVRLRELSESRQSLFDFILEQFDICGFPEAAPFIETILKKGKAIVLFDGLDEINKADGLRDKVIQEIKNFSDKYDQSKVLITCRVAASEYLFEGFSVVEMADFEEAQIKTFVHKWFSEAPEISETFFKEFDQHAGNGLRDLSKSPLLLTLLCIGFEETLHFPDRRSEIYGEALDALLKKRDSARKIKRDTIYGPLSPGRKTQMFARIAAETFEKGEYLFEKKGLKKKIVDYLKKLPQACQNEEIDGEAILSEIEAQHGIFVERSKGVYSFAHLSFQEYYAAHYTISGSEGRLSRLMPFAFDARWREVFLLTAEMLDDADGFFHLLVNRLDEQVSKQKRLNALLIKGDGPSLQQRKLSLVLILDLACGLSHDITLDRTCGLARALAYVHTHYFTLARALAQTLEEALDFNLGSTFALARGMALTRTFHEKTLSLSKEKGFEHCRQLLLRLPFPNQNASPEAWKNFSEELLDIFKATFNIEEYEFTKEEAQQVNKYLEATKLLLDCLKVAYVSDRAAIEDRLLRPVESHPHKKDT